MNSDIPIIVDPHERIDKLTVRVNELEKEIGMLFDIIADLLEEDEDEQ